MELPPLRCLRRSKVGRAEYNGIATTSEFIVTCSPARKPQKRDDSAPEVCNRDSTCLGRCRSRCHTTRYVKTDGPKQVEKNHQVHHFIPLGERPHSTRSVLEIHDLRGRHSRDGGLMPDHQCALE